MKKIYFILSIVLLATTNRIQAQNDSIYFWKNNVMLHKQSIKTADLDSITFRRPYANLPNVTICNQIWTTQNLDVSTYSDGTPIPQVTDPTQWTNLTTGAWCYYNNDPANAAVYGKLYNWYAVAGIYDAASAANPALRKKLAPTGWHIPTDAEWTQLTDCLGGAAIAGGKMKSTGTVQAVTGLWEDPNTAATNESGFTGLPGGFRYQGSSLFYYIGSGGLWWSSSESLNGDVWSRSLFNNSGQVFTFVDPKATGFSVRCVRD
jgi:uncharacterized protein (TIGR02145 family)